MTGRDRPQSGAQVAADLEARIRTGEFPPGSRLPSRRELAADGVGVYAARRALELLAARGLVVARPGDGARVVDVLPARVPTVEERLAALEAWRASVEGRDG